VTADPRAEARLETFLRRVERVRVEDLLAYAAHPLNRTAYRKALDEAARVARERGREARISGLREAAERWVLTVYGSSNQQPGWYEVNWGRPGSVEDRAWLAESLGTAAAAILLSDDLPEDVVDELLGPWATLLGVVGSTQAPHRPSGTQRPGRQVGGRSPAAVGKRTSSPHRPR